MARPRSLIDKRVLSRVQLQLREANGNLKDLVASCKSFSELRMLVKMVNDFKRSIGENDLIIDNHEQSRIFVPDRDIRLIKMQVRNAIARSMRHVGKES